jgi:hypothetical protein
VESVEARSRRTNIKGKPALINAAMQRIEADEDCRIAAEIGTSFLHSAPSRNVARAAPRRSFSLDNDGLPRGVLVGTIEIIGCEPLNPKHSQSACFAIPKSTAGFAWLLKNSRRSDPMVKPVRHPQPSFFDPF